MLPGRPLSKGCTASFRLGQHDALQYVFANVGQPKQVVIVRGYSTVVPVTGSDNRRVIIAVPLCYGVCHFLQALSVSPRRMLGGWVGGGRFPPAPLTPLYSRLPSARSTLPSSGRLSHKMFDTLAVHFMTLLSQLLCRFRPHLPWHDYDSQVNVWLIASRFVQSSSW